MKIKCLHGYYIFTEENVGEISDFMALTNLKIVPREEYFTFDKIKSAPQYSLIGKPISGLNAIKSSQGNPWYVFEKNGFVYDFIIDQMRPIQSLENIVDINKAGNRFYANGLILAGSVNQFGLRVKNYSGFYSRSTGTFLYSEVTYV